MGYGRACVGGWHWSPCAALAGSTDTDHNRRNGSRRSAKDSIGTSRSAGLCADWEGFLEYWYAPPGGREKRAEKEWLARKERLQRRARFLGSSGFAGSVTRRQMLYPFFQDFSRFSSILGLGLDIGSL